MIKNSILLLVVLVVVLPAKYLEADGVIGRQMSVHAFQELGLEIWLETDPEPIYKIESTEKKPMLHISTPANVYPPISMSVVSFINMPVLPGEFDTVFDALLATALKQHGLSSESTVNIVKRETLYGELEGIEVEFQTNKHGDSADAKVFLGMGRGKGPVLLQAYTLAGKMSHIDGKLRRSWGNIRYLD